MLYLRPAAYPLHRTTKAIVAVSISALLIVAASSEGHAGERPSCVSDLSGPSPPANGLVSPDFSAEGVALFSLFDGVGPYRKNGLFEIYGASLRERRSGPITVTEADIEVSHAEAWVLWSPDSSAARTATGLEVKFVELPEAGVITVGMILENRETIAFSYDFGQRTSQAENLLPPIVPEDAKTLASSASVSAFRRCGLELFAGLPSNIMQQLRAEGDQQISQLFVKIEGAAGRVFRIRNLSFTEPKTDSVRKTVTLSGTVLGIEIGKDAEIELLDELGRRQRHALGDQGRFLFSGLNPATPVSLRVRYKELLSFSTLGRWILPAYSRNDIVVKPPKAYVNEDGHLSKVTDNKDFPARGPSPYWNQEEPHSRFYYRGPGSIQEFDNITFHNNFGYLDRDRFFDNPDGCIRLASTGASDVVAVQVRPVEKYNIILEEELGVAIQRCVEVISAAIDGANLGANYPRIRDYFGPFRPSYTLMSIVPSNVSSLSPTMLRDGTGLDPENNPFPSFLFDGEGQLQFRPGAPDYMLFTSKPTQPEYFKGIAWGATLQVPFEDMPAEGREAFRYLAAIMQYISKKLPDQKIVLQTGPSQAYCRTYCQRSLTLAGKAVAIGAKVFQSNIEHFCRENNFLCVGPEFSEKYGSRDLYLTFVDDPHYNQRGHQWLAQELAKLLAPMLRGHTQGDSN